MIRNELGRNCGCGVHLHISTRELREIVIDDESLHPNTQEPLGAE